MIEIYRALRAHPGLHTAYLVYHTLTVEACAGPDGATNGQIAKTLGVSHKTVLRALRTLALLGLVVPCRPRQTGGFETILLVADLSQKQLDLLRRVEAGEAVEDLELSKFCADTSVLTGTENAGREDMGVLTGLPEKGVFWAKSLPNVHLLLSKYLNVEYTQLDYIYNIYILNNSLNNFLNGVSKGGNLAALSEPLTLFGPSGLRPIEDRPIDLATLREEIRREVIAEFEAQGRLKPLTKKQLMQVATYQPIAERLFAVWAQEFGHARAVLTEARRELLFRRLSEGYTEEQLAAVIRWAAANPWYRGRDPKTNGRAYEDLQYYLGSKEKVDRNVLEAMRRGPKPNSLMARPNEPVTARRI